MAKSNRNTVSDILEATRRGLGPFVMREYKEAYGGAFLDEMKDVLRSGAYAPKPFSDVKTAFAEIDLQGWLNLMMRRWHEVFKRTLGHAERSYVSELLEIRNNWAHQKPISTDDAYRAADTATRLLQAVNAVEAAHFTQLQGRALRRRQFAEEARTAERRTTHATDVPTTTQKGLKPWRLVIQPQQDVAQGRFEQAEFAADLAQVYRGDAEPEYNDPAEFFRRTYLTEGLVGLLANGLRRLNGLGGDPVIQLKTEFGGGKTHSMIALYHLVGGQIGLSSIPGGERVMAVAGDVEDRIEANRAVIVGTAFDPTNARMHDSKPPGGSGNGAITHTLWGEIAWQLGGADGYDMVADADISGVSPGSDTLVALLDRYGPALVIIDELVAFARNLWNVREPLMAGSFDANMTFIQSLTEATRRAKDAVLLISIPQSAEETGGEGGQEAKAYLEKTIGRLESVWKPVTPTESFEIVRRRLFESKIDYAERDAVIKAFQKMYSQGKGDYPAECGGGEYAERMKAAYPLHPELFDRLYQDWSTLEKFQRTRGVLRLMAKVIHALWANNDQSLMIMPGSIPLDQRDVQAEITRLLPEGWTAVIDADIDGRASRPARIDDKVRQLGQLQASRRMARATFMGSAPSVSQQNVRGVLLPRLHLGVAQPGESLGRFDDALRRMTSRLMYLYADGDRYWYDTRPTVNRMAQDRAESIEAHAVSAEIVGRLQGLPFSRNDFAALHVAPAGPADVVDEDRTRLVVIGPDYGYNQKEQGSAAETHALAILQQRGANPRAYRNMLLFLAADERTLDPLHQKVRIHLAWTSILADEVRLNLDVNQRKQVEDKIGSTGQDVDRQVEAAYCWLLAPEDGVSAGVAPQSSTGKSAPTIAMEGIRLRGSGNPYARAAQSLRNDGLLIDQWSADGLALELQRYFWGAGETHVAIQRLWESLAQYVYMPRLFNQEVLLKAIGQGAQASGGQFGIADGLQPRSPQPPGGGHEHSKYPNSHRPPPGGSPEITGLVFASDTPVYVVNLQGIVVRADVAQAQMAEDAREQTERAIAEGGSTPADGKVTPRPPSQGGAQTPTQTPVAPAKQRYYGRSELNPRRIHKDVEQIADEILIHLTELAGTQVRVTLTIEAQNDQGFEERTARTIGENSRVLGFEESVFE